MDSTYLPDSRTRGPGQRQVFREGTRIVYVQKKVKMGVKTERWRKKNKQLRVIKIKQLFVFMIPSPTELRKDRDVFRCMFLEFGLGKGNSLSTSHNELFDLTFLNPAKGI